jgi:p-hydroxybenzoate 3-monooxygenase
MGPVARTQVAIVGAGPAGLMLSHLLHRAGIASVVVEARTREHAEHRMRAGVLEQTTVDLLASAGLDGRMRREGMVHRGIELRFEGEGHRIDLAGLTGGRAITVYGQQQVVKDLLAARTADGARIDFGAEHVRIEGFGGSAPSVHYRHAGRDVQLACEFIAGCDGFHGVCRAAVPGDAMTIHEREYPFAWLGVLVDAAPARDELVYANHERGFALFSMRSPTRTRLYLQVAPDEALDAWSDARLWDELRARLGGRDGFVPRKGPIVERMVTGMRSFVTEPMRFGRLFLAGDAAHIVPPTGAKGLNLAMADVAVLARAFAAHFDHGDDRLLDAYSATCLERVWRAEHFSWWMTTLLHRFPDADPFERRLQRAQLRYITTSHAAATALAENYVGLPLDLE